jgi:hypothetical protein
LFILAGAKPGKMNANYIIPILNLLGGFMDRYQRPNPRRAGRNEGGRGRENNRGRGRENKRESYRRNYNRDDGNNALLVEMQRKQDVENQQSRNRNILSLILMLAVCCFLVILVVAFLLFLIFLSSLYFGMNQSKS